jgi:hypothetical protein
MNVGNNESTRRRLKGRSDDVNHTALVVKATLSLCLIRHHSVKRWIGGIAPHNLCTGCSGQFHAPVGEIAIQWMGDCVGPRAYLDAVAKIKSALSGILTHYISRVQETAMMMKQKKRSTFLWLRKQFFRVIRWFVDAPHMHKIQYATKQNSLLRKPPFSIFFFFLDIGWVLSSPYRVQKIKIGPSINFLVFLYPSFLLLYN